MIDLHSHVLPGIDDGPPDMAGSLALARAAVAAGTSVMAATPHIGLQYPVLADELPERVAELRRALAAARIPLEVVVGGELATSRAANISDQELDTIALGGGSCVLLECPFTRVGGLMATLVARLRERGFRVLLGHPERSPEFWRDTATLAALVRAGAFVQVTAGSLRGDFGRPVRRYALALLGSGLVHVVASDAHDAVSRSPAVLSVVRDAVRGRESPEAVTRFVTEEAPRALLDDAPLPGQRWLEPQPSTARGAQEAIEATNGLPRSFVPTCPPLRATPSGRKMRPKSESMRSFEKRAPAATPSRKRAILQGTPFGGRPGQQREPIRRGLSGGGATCSGRRRAPRAGSRRCRSAA